MTTNPENNTSEVRRVLCQIEAEYIAGQRAVYDLALGTSQHRIINARMERIGVHQAELAELVGDKMAAMALVVKCLDEVQL